MQAAKIKKKINTSEAAKLLGVKKSTIRDYIKSGMLKGYMGKNGRYKVDRKEVLKLKKSNKKKHSKGKVAAKPKNKVAKSRAAKVYSHSKSKKKFIIRDLFKYKGISPVIEIASVGIVFNKRVIDKNSLKELRRIKEFEAGDGIIVDARKLDSRYTNAFDVLDKALVPLN